MNQPSNNALIGPKNQQLVTCWECSGNGLIEGEDECLLCHGDGHLSQMEIEERYYELMLQDEARAQEMWGDL